MGRTEVNDNISKLFAEVGSRCKLGSFFTEVLLAGSCVLVGTVWFPSPCVECVETMLQL